MTFQDREYQQSVPALQMVESIAVLSCHKTACNCHNKINVSYMVMTFEVSNILLVSRHFLLHYVECH